MTNGSINVSLADDQAAMFREGGDFSACQLLLTDNILRVSPPMSPKNVSHVKVPRTGQADTVRASGRCMGDQGQIELAIGEIIHCSEGTVKKLLQRVYRKLGVENRFSLLALFLRRQPLLPVDQLQRHLA